MVITIIVNFYEGFVSEIRAFFLGYRLAKIHQDELVMDISQFYRGSFWSFHMDLLNIPEIKKISFRDIDVVKCIENKYNKQVVVVENGTQLEKIHNSYDKNEIYYIINDSYFYDDFFLLHREFFFRYIGDDNITQELFSTIEVKKPSREYSKMLKMIKAPENVSVGVHIRLGDFYNVGWIVEKDFEFYRAAIQLFRELEANAKFFIFSDDIEMASKILGEKDDIVYVHFPFSYQSDIEELLCIAECKRRILDKKSTYGLFAEAVAQNRHKNDGLTVIIKERHFQDNAGNKEYVEKATNTDEGVNQREYFGMYKELDASDIKHYAQKYGYKAQGRYTTDDGKEKKSSIRGVVFATRQTYAKSCPHGLQYLAHFLSKHDYIVGFIGKNMDCGEEIQNILSYVFEHSDVELGMNSLVSEIQLFSYNLLNKYMLYTGFYDEYRRQNELEKLYIVVRKPIALPPLEKHGDNIYIFIDFTDPWDEESKNCLKEYDAEEIDYMYDNADYVITFNNKVSERGYLKNKVIYIDLDRAYPSMLEPMGEQSPQQLRNGMDKYCNEIMKVLDSI